MTYPVPSATEKQARSSQSGLAIGEVPLKRCAHTMVINSLDPDGKRSARQAAAASAGLAVTSLFSGIGGMELGLSRSGHHPRMFCEIDAAARAVLKSRFEGVGIKNDVTKLQSIPRDSELLTMGFPCQDLSQAGRTKGVFGKASGLVWKAFDLIAKTPPPWVLIENVPFMLKLRKGEAMAEIVSRLGGLGYRWAYRVVDARAFGLPQRRPRVFILASKTGDPADVLFAGNGLEPNFDEGGVQKAMGFYWTEGNRGLGAVSEGVPPLKSGSTLSIPSPPAIVTHDRGVVTPHINDAERLQGFPVSWTAPASAVGGERCRWRLVGNAVNVRVAAWIGRRLVRHQPYDRSKDVVFDPRRPWPTAAYSVGKEIYVSEMSGFPEGDAPTPISEFLRFPPKQLSLRATRGIVSRLKRSSLNIPEFLMAGLELHLARLEPVE